MRIGERIKQRRLELGYTADTLAKMLNKNRATIYRYENGDIENMPIDVLEPLAKALNTTPAYLMGWSSEQSTKKNPNAQTSTNMSVNNSKDDDLDSSAALSFCNGDQEMDEDTKNLLRISLENSIRLAKERAKQKFTPNKYKNK